MPKSRCALLSVLALAFALLSFLLLLPLGFASWLGVLFAILAISLGRFARPQEKWQEVFCLLGMLLPPLAGIVYGILFFL